MALDGNHLKSPFSEKLKFGHLEKDFTPSLRWISRHIETSLYQTICQLVPILGCPTEYCVIVGGGGGGGGGGDDVENLYIDAMRVYM